MIMRSNCMWNEVTEFAIALHVLPTPEQLSVPLNTIGFPHRCLVQSLYSRHPWDNPHFRGGFVHFSVQLGLCMVRLKNVISVRENYINPTHIYYGKIPIFCCGCYQADPNVTVSMLHNNIIWTSTQGIWLHGKCLQCSSFFSW